MQLVLREVTKFSRDYPRDGAARASDEILVDHERRETDQKPTSEDR